MSRESTGSFVIQMGASMKLWLTIMFLVLEIAIYGHLNFLKDMDLNYGLLLWKKHGRKYMVHMIE